MIGLTLDFQKNPPDAHEYAFLNIHYKLSIKNIITIKNDYDKMQILRRSKDAFGCLKSSETIFKRI